MLCFLFVFIPCSISAQKYSLDELYGLALERSETIKILEEDLYISKREKAKARSILMPRLSAFGEHTKYSREKGIGSFTIQPDYTNTWGLRLDQSISTGGKEIIAYKMAKDGIVRSRYDLDSVKEEYLLSVASIYYDLLKAKKAMQIAEANVERLKKHRDAAEIRLSVGEVTKTVLLRAKAELSGAQSDLIKAQNSLNVAKAILASRVGIRGDYDVEEKEGIEDYSKEEFISGCLWNDLACLKETALSERSEIKSFKMREKIAKQEITYTKGSHLPTVSVEGLYSRRESSPSTSFGLEESIYAGLKLDFPLFEGGMRKAEVNEARAKSRQAELSLLDKKKSIDVEVEIAYLDLTAGLGVITKLESQAAYAGENYNMVSQQFKHGLANSVDVMDANTLLVTAERQLANARLDYEVFVLRLKRAVGIFLKTVMRNE